MSDSYIQDTGDLAKDLRRANRISRILGEVEAERPKLQAQSEAEVAKEMGTAPAVSAPARASRRGSMDAGRGVGPNLRDAETGAAIPMARLKPVEGFSGGAVRNVKDDVEDENLGSKIIKKATAPKPQILSQRQAGSFETAEVEGRQVAASAPSDYSQLAAESTGVYESPSENISYGGARLNADTQSGLTKGVDPLAMAVGKVYLKAAGRCNHWSCQEKRARGMELTGLAGKVQVPGGKYWEAHEPAIPSIAEDVPYNPIVGGKETRPNPRPTTRQYRPADPNDPRWKQAVAESTESSILSADDYLEHHHDD